MDWSCADYLQKWGDILPSMVTHTRNLCSAFNPSKVHTHNSEHTHPEQWAAIYAVVPGEQFGVRYLAQGHLVVVLRLKLVTFRLWVWLSTIRAHDPLALWIIVVFIFFFFNSCLDSHSDGTHSLQRRIQCWVSKVMLMLGTHHKIILGWFWANFSPLDNPR